MHLLSSIGLSIIGYFPFMYITVNLTGMVVRGFFHDPRNDLLKNYMGRTKYNRIDVGTTIVFSIVSVLFLYLLYRYLNIWAVVSASLLVFGRIPDLIWEIRNGRKVTMNDGPKGGLHSVTGFTVPIALLIFWWSIYNL